MLAFLALWSVSAQQGCNDLKKSVTHLKYYPIRDMRQTIAPDPQRMIWSETGKPVVWAAVPDSLSVPTIGVDPYMADAAPYDVSGAKLHSPESTDASVARGDSLFHTICWTCHGKTLAGDGPVAPKMAETGAVPTDLLSEGPRSRTDAFIYMYMRHGGALMPSYGNVLGSRDAWSIVHYIRHMQKTSPR
jgi:mono/diheme cytochrome c family protein